QILCFGGKIVEQLRPTHAAMPAKGAKISVTLKIQAVLLHTHVTHAQPMRHFSHRQALTSLEQVDDREPLAAAYLGDETLHETERMLSRRSIQIFRGFPSKNLRKMHKDRRKEARPFCNRSAPPDQRPATVRRASGGKSSENVVGSGLRRPLRRKDEFLVLKTCLFKA